MPKYNKCEMFYRAPATTKEIPIYSFRKLKDRSMKSKIWFVNLTKRTMIAHL